MHPRREPLLEHDELHPRLVHADRVFEVVEGEEEVVARIADPLDRCTRHESAVVDDEVGTAEAGQRVAGSLEGRQLLGGQMVDDAVAEDAARQRHDADIERGGALEGVEQDAQCTGSGLRVVVEQPEGVGLGVDA